MPLTSIHHVNTNKLDIFDISLSKNTMKRIKKHNIKVRDNGGE